MHTGHRKRLKNRFLEEGLDSFEPHQVLELLLFFSIPRRDTNEIAHKLLKIWFTVRVFEADIKELVKVEGIGENSAFNFNDSSIIKSTLMISGGTSQN